MLPVTVARAANELAGVEDLASVIATLVGQTVGFAFGEAFLLPSGGDPPDRRFLARQTLITAGVSALLWAGLACTRRSAVRLPLRRDDGRLGARSARRMRSSPSLHPVLPASPGLSRHPVPLSLPWSGGMAGARWPGSRGAVLLLGGLGLACGGGDRPVRQPLDRAGRHHLRGSGRGPADERWPPDRARPGATGPGGPHRPALRCRRGPGHRRRTADQGHGLHGRGVHGSRGDPAQVRFHGRPFGPDDRRLEFHGTPRRADGGHEPWNCTAHCSSPATEPGRSPTPRAPGPRLCDSPPRRPPLRPLHRAAHGLRVARRRGRGPPRPHGRHGYDGIRREHAVRAAGAVPWLAHRGPAVGSAPALSAAADGRRRAGRDRGWLRVRRLPRAERPVGRHARGRPRVVPAHGPYGVLHSGRHGRTAGGRGLRTGGDAAGRLGRTGAHRHPVAGCRWVRPRSR
ncbi:hypothetical protein ACRAWF_19570 [Streptomyces sp. L7]